jgi:Spx/MgsR family transcriptional regulator
LITVYGIKNCDTCRKARKWLTDNNIEHRYHDFRADGLEPSTVKGWVADVGWEKLLNRRGTTWRKLAEADREDMDADKATRLMAENPTLIKRPVFDLGDRRLVGFKSAEQEALKA